MKKLAIILLALGAAACASTASQSYRSPSNPGETWTVEGRQSFFGAITITINGETAVTGKVSMSSGDAELTGAYRGQPVTVACARGGSSSVRTRCVVSHGGERIATLYFKSL